jgi:hypothetical protein
VRPPFLKEIVRETLTLDAALILRLLSRGTVSRIRLSPLVLALVAILLGGVVRTGAQDVTEVRLKGAFIFNFARFADWPADALASSPTMLACVAGDRAIGEALSRAVSGQRLNGRPIAVSWVDPKGPIPMCHLLYVSGIERARMTELVMRLRETPVLTVSDDDSFLKAGGIIQIFIESGKMRFRINPRSAKRARLQLSSRLLALADLVDIEPLPALAGPGAPAR